MISILMNPEPRAVFLKYLMEDPLSLARLSEELVFFFQQRVPQWKNTEWALLNIRIHSCIIAQCLGHGDLNAVALQEQAAQAKP